MLRQPSDDGSSEGRGSKMSQQACMEFIALCSETSEKIDALWKRGYFECERKRTSFKWEYKKWKVSFLSPLSFYYFVHVRFLSVLIDTFKRYTAINSKSGAPKIGPRRVRFKPALTPGTNSQPFKCCIKMHPINWHTQMLIVTAVHSKRSPTWNTWE